MHDYMKTNQDWWNEVAQVHASGDAYMMKEFKAGMIKLHPLERAEVGDIDFFHEHQFCAWECLPDMEEGADRFMRFKDLKKREMIPLMFSLKATKG